MRPLLYLKLNRDSSEKNDLLVVANQHASVYVDLLIVASGACGFVRERSCIKELLHAVHGAADTNELFDQIMTDLQQRSNVLPTVEMNLYGPSLPCG